MLIVGEAVSDFVGARVGTVIVPPYTAIGEARDGRVVAGVVFNCFTRTDIEATVATIAPPSRRLLRRCGAYVFGELGCCRITITTESGEVAALAKRLNAQTEGRKRNQYGPGRDGIVLGILREDWKF